MANGLLRVVSNSELDAAQQQETERRKAIDDSFSPLVLDNLAHHLRTEFSRFRRYRTEREIDTRLMTCLRTYRGEYPDDKLAAIRQFGGSEVYSRISAIKSRGAAALLKDIYLSKEKPWEIEPTSDPSIPQDVTEAVTNLVDSEVAGMMMQGMTPGPGEIERRTRDLLVAVENAIARTAKEDADRMTKQLSDIMEEGGWTTAMSEFLTDLTIYPIAVMKGPIVEMRTRMQWRSGKMDLKREPVMQFSRRDPYYIYFSPGASSVADADVLEVVPVSRHDLSKLIGVDGFNEDAIRQVLEDYGRGGLRDWLDDNDQVHAELTDQDSPSRNESKKLDMLEYSGHVQGSMLRQYGMTNKQVPDEDMDYSCKVWLIGRHVIKVVLNPNPARKHEYYTASFEAVPGSIYGISLIETLQDVQDIANASLRALVNNMSIASGPQVVINTDRLDPTMDADELHPWKRWRVNSDPYSTGGAVEKPIDFFQPQSNAQELLGVYQQMTAIADEISAIPRYLTGSDKVGGAGETASGLAMLMNNASKVMQSVATSIDNRVMAPMLRTLYNYVMLTDKSGMFRGDEQIVVKGVAVAMAKETDRMRKLEYLQLTTNPIDMQITGIEGRANMLRDIGSEVGFSRDPIPTALQIRDKQRMAEEAARLQQLTGGQVGKQGVANNAPPPSGAPPPRTSVADNTGGM